MKKYFIIAVLLMFSLFLSEFSFANQSNPPDNDSQFVLQTGQENANIKEIKNMIIKLVRQDEYLDGILELIEDSNNNLTSQDMEAMNLNIKLIRNNLEHILLLAKKQFPEIQPSHGLSKYTKTMLSYTGKLDKKISFLNRSVSASINKKSKMRDALSSKKTSKSGGKKLTLILEEEKGMRKLSEHIKQLRSSSKKLNAASKWLYVVSK